jgi:hypothetical protein
MMSCACSTRCLEREHLHRERLKGRCMYIEQNKMPKPLHSIAHILLTICAELLVGGTGVSSSMPDPCAAGI